MYGSVARVKVRPGAYEELERLGREEMPHIPGFVFQHTYRLDADPDTLMLVIAFESKEAYQANAASPEQAGRDGQFRALMASDPEWNDGEIVHSHSQ